MREWDQESYSEVTEVDLKFTKEDGKICNVQGRVYSKDLIRSQEREDGPWSVKSV